MNAIRFAGILMLAVAAAVPLPARAADDDWLGGPTKDRPVRTNVSLAEQQLTVAGAEVWPLKLDPRWTAAEACFSKDGAFLYLLDKRGVLRKIQTADMIEILRLSLAVPCDQIVMSAAGLTVSDEAHKTLWVISPDTLAVIRKIPVVGTRYSWLAASPASPFAYMTDLRLSGPKGYFTAPLARLDLSTGRISPAQWDEPKGWSSPLSQDVRQPVLTPDGRYAMLTNLSDGLFRYRVAGEKLVYEDRSHDKGPGGVSGKTVTMAGGNYAYCSLIRGDLDHKFAGRSGIYVYDFNKLDKPAMVLPARQGLALDLQRTRAFGLDGDRVSVMDLDGRERWASKVPEKNTVAGAAAEGIWLSPSGREVLIYVRGMGLYWMKVPEDIMAVRDGKDVAPAPAVKEPSIRSSSVARKVKGISITDLALRPQDVLPDPLLDADGNTLTVLSPQGVVRQYGTEDGKCLRKLDVGRPCATIGRSSEGLVVLARGPGEIWVLNENTLAVKKLIPVPYAGELACSQGAWWCFVFSEINASYERMVTHVDLRSGELKRTIESVPDMQAVTREGRTVTRLIEGGWPRLSRDGKTLFTVNTSLHRWLWDGSRLLRAESAGIGVSSDFCGAALSDDSQYIAVCGPETAVFWARDVRKPVLSNLELGLRQYESAAVALDQSRRRLYVVKQEVLNVFDAAGRLQDSIFLPAPPQKLTKPLEQTSNDDLLSQVRQERRDIYKASSGVRSIALASRARKMLVLTGYTSVWVDLPAPSSPVEPAGPEGQWLGDKAIQKRMAAMMQGVSVKTETSVPAEVREVAGAKVVTLKKEPDSLVPTLIWSADGKSFFVLGTDGLLRQIGIDPVREVCRFQLPQRCHAMARSKCGLVIGGSRFGDLYLVSEDTLALQWKRTISGGPIGRIFAAPAGEYALVEATDAPGTYLSTSNRLAYVSLKDGKVVHDSVLAKMLDLRKPLDGSPPKQYPTQFRFIPLVVMHPDGRSVWAPGQRFVLSKDSSTLVPAQVLGQLVTADSPANMSISPQLSWLCFSGDGRYWSIQSADKIRGFPKVDYSATFIFRTDKLDKPLTTIAHDEDGGVVAFADAQKLLYEYTRGGRLRVYHGSGDMVKEIEVNVKPARTAQDRIINRQAVECLAVQPDGRGLVVMTHDLVCHIRLPDEMFAKKGE